MEHGQGEVVRLLTFGTDIVSLGDAGTELDLVFTVDLSILFLPYFSLCVSFSSSSFLRMRHEVQAFPPSPSPLLYFLAPFLHVSAAAISGFLPLLLLLRLLPGTPLNLLWFLLVLLPGTLFRPFLQLLHHRSLPVRRFLRSCWCNCCCYLSSRCHGFCSRCFGRCCRHRRRRRFWVEVAKSYVGTIWICVQTLRNSNNMAYDSPPPAFACLGIAIYLEFQTPVLLV